VNRPSSGLSAWRISLVLTLSCALDGSTAAAQPSSLRRANVVVIMVDSMGYGDSEPYGGTDIRTPQLRRFAREGVRLTDGYANGPVCTPTRAALLTGRYQQRFGLEWFLTKERKDAGLPRSEVAIASVLKDRGYRTAVFGKWHLGYTPEFGPNAHGFEEFFGHLDFSIDYYTHRNIDGAPDLWENDKPVERTGYMTDLITERSVAYIERHKDEPYFLFVAYNAMVPPVQVPDRPDDVRTSSNWGQAGRVEYSRMVERMDEGVGKILDAVDRSGRGGDTLVIFTNDHGGQWYSRRTPLFHGFGTLWEGGIRVPLMLRWPGRLPAGSVSGQVAATMDLMPTILAATGVADATVQMDGVNLLPMLSGTVAPIERTLFWRVDRPTRNQRAARKGAWKYVRDGTSQLLFDVAKDPAERDDVGYQHPEVMAEFRTLITAWESDLAKTPPPFVVK